MKPSSIIFICLLSLTSFAQNAKDQFVKDKRSGCLIWVTNYNPRDSLSISWEGACKNNMADGPGTLTWYIKNTEVSRYVGSMQKGNPNGQGKYTFPGGVIQEGHFVNGFLNGNGKITFTKSGKKLEGNFVDGEILNLDKEYLDHLQRNLISKNDNTDMYVNDRNSKDLIYYALIPGNKIKGVVVLLPGTWDRVEYVLSCNKALCQQAFNNGIAVIVPSINQRLTLNAEVLDFLNTVFSDAISRYKLPRDKFVLGGFSMGGLFSTRYTEMAYEDHTKTVVIPKAVYSVDGPTDLENHYKEFEKAAERNPNADEPRYAINEFKKIIGGPPDKFHEKYVYYSTFSKSEKDGGNAKYLKNVPVRIYNDVDVNWWLINRGADLYDMNALDQSAMINFLHGLGNKKADFINAFGKGYRLDGTRHPHSWSIVDAGDCINWIKKCLD